VHSELALIAAFVKRSKRDHYRDFVSNPRLRQKFIDKLAHFSDFDPRYRSSIEGDNLVIDNIASQLEKKHSPKIIYAISASPALDQKELSLVEALHKTVGSHTGTVLSCIPGRLAFVETEGERFILERHGQLEKREYVRFVVGREDVKIQVERGIFQAAALALEWGDIKGADANDLKKLLIWFGDNLEKPTSTGRDQSRFGVCWFKTDSTEHIARAWQMVHILERNGLHVREIRTDKPGYVIYEDGWQLVTERAARPKTPRK
jgi:hypothetical protein